jgi:hypothetical protein
MFLSVQLKKILAINFNIMLIQRNSILVKLRVFQKRQFLRETTAVWELEVSREESENRKSLACRTLLSQSDIYDAVFYGILDKFCARTQSQFFHNLILVELQAF